MRQISIWNKQFHCLLAKLEFNAICIGGYRYKVLNLFVKALGVTNKDDSPVCNIKNTFDCGILYIIYI